MIDEISKDIPLYNKLKLQNNKKCNNVDIWLNIANEEELIIDSFQFPLNNL